jgi:uncharacterized protein (TIRG00374 family)
MDDQKSKKNPWVRHLGLIVAVIPLIWIYWRLDLRTMVSILPTVAWWTIPVLMIIVVTCMTLQGIRWWILLRSQISGFPLGRALSYHFIGAFYGVAVPSGIAQDVIKTVLVANKKGVSVSWAALWVTRILGLPALGILSIYGFIAMDRTSLPKGIEYALATLYGAALLLFCISFSKRITSPVRRATEKIIPRRIAKLIGDIREGIYQYRNRKREVLLSFLVTFVAQVLLVISSCVTLKGITGNFFWWQCFAFIPLIELISVSFPFTPNGMGVREMLSAGLFAFLQLSHEQLGIYVLFLLFFGFAVRLIGIIPLVHGYFKKSSGRDRTIRVI